MRCAPGLSPDPGRGAQGRVQPPRRWVPHEQGAALLTGIQDPVQVLIERRVRQDLTGVTQTIAVAVELLVIGQAIEIAVRLREEEDVVDLDDPTVVHGPVHRVEDERHARDRGAGRDVDRAETDEVIGLGEVPEAYAVHEERERVECTVGASYAGGAASGVGGSAPTGGLGGVVPEGHLNTDEVLGGRRRDADLAITRDAIGGVDSSGEARGPWRKAATLNQAPVARDAGSGPGGERVEVHEHLGTRDGSQQADGCGGGEQFHPQRANRTTRR